MWKITDSYKWDYLRETFSWIKDMEGVPQDHVHHAEGDVAIHTGMVLEALINLMEFKNLEEQEQHILIAAALLHDVEKRSTTIIENDGRITSRGHAKKGEFTTRSILYKNIPTPFDIREQICKLVRYHGLPLWVFEKTDPVKAVIEASMTVNTRLLAILAKADVLGRVCTDQQDLLYKIDLFIELCKENNCFGQPYPFHDNYSRFFYFQKENVSPEYIAFNDTRFKVIVLAALPGSGKDTYYRKALSEYPVISLDDIRREMNIKPTDSNGNGKVIQMAKEQAKVYMRQHKSFVWNATNITKQMREQLIDLFLSYGAYVEIHYLEVPYQTLMKQNNEREYIVPTAAIDKMISKLEVPTFIEANIIKYFINE